MGVPAEIRAVPRPVNTVVIDTKTNSCLRYSVKQRIGCKHVVGKKNPRPVDGKVIGYIIDGRFVPKEQASGPRKTATVVYEDNLPAPFLSFGASALLFSVSEDLRSDIYRCFGPKNGQKILTIAFLRIIRPGICDSKLYAAYLRNWTSIYFPGVALSKNSVSAFMDYLGRDEQSRMAFTNMRFDSVAIEHHIAIDGVLVQNTSKVNDLSGFSYKARIKGCEELSILYAYDVEKMEPVCAQVFPGSMPDLATCKAFIEANKISKGVIVAEKGFSASQFIKIQQKRPDISYLIPLKRNDKRLLQLNLTRMEGTISAKEPVAYCKRESPKGTWLYSFCNLKMANAENRNYVQQKHLSGNFDADEFEKKKLTAGLIVFESDKDIPPEAVYKTYRDRWLLELVFKQYKTNLDANKTRVQGDFSVLGSEFINFLCTILTCRIINLFESKEFLNSYSYGALMEDLCQAWRRTGYGNDATEGDAHWIHTPKNTQKMMADLGFIKAAPKEPEVKNKTKDAKDKKKAIGSEDFGRLKRPRGRPRKQK